MSEQPGVSDEYRMASPWPLFVALGFALSEVGVFLGVLPVAVAGILLLGASVTGILRESGYVSDVWRVLAALGGVFALLGAGLVATQVPPGSLAIVETVAAPNGAVGRGLAVAIAGVMLVAAAATGRVVGTARL
ncbi:cox cluster protein [Halobacteriales archaeon QH_10_67_22]|nr:MAG: cox cluster protein [Halobacteriales archaeon QH_10_67_22]